MKTKYGRIAAFLFWLIVAVVALAAFRAVSGVVTEEFLDRIAQRESGNNSAAVGRRGEIGAYQIRPCALADVNEHFGWRVKSADMHRPEIGRAVARAYCLMLERRLGSALHRQPTNSEIYSSWRFGVRGAFRAGKLTRHDDFWSYRVTWPYVFVGSTFRPDTGANTTQRVGTATAGMPTTNSAERAGGTILRGATPGPATNSPASTSRQPTGGRVGPRRGWR